MLHTSDALKAVIEASGLVVDASGVLVILLGLLYATWNFIFARRHTEEPFRRYRKDLGRGILLGLEFLVAADIIRTVAVAPSLQSVTVLAIIVLIRTFLSMTLQIELEGRPPWNRKPPP